MDTRKPSDGPTLENGHEDFDSLDRYYELTQLRPWGRNTGKWLKELEGSFGLEWVIRAMEAEWAKDKTPVTFLGRVDARLSREAEQVRSAKVKEAKDKPKGDPEAEARQRAALAEMIQPNGGAQG